MSFMAALLLAGCAGVRAPVTPPPPAPATAGLDAGDVFSREGVEGVFVLRDEATGCVRTTDAVLADQGFSPQSTFKVPHALIGLETGVIAGEHHLWRWDGTPRRLRVWEQDLDLAGALRLSCVPCFQDVARRIDRMLAGDLPVKRSRVALIWRLLERESGPGFTFRGKSGLGLQDGRAVGWLVGYVERAGHRWIYATLVLGRVDADGNEEMRRLMPLREKITRALLRRARVLAEPGDGRQ